MLATEPVGTLEEVQGRGGVFHTPAALSAAVGSRGAEEIGELQDRTLVVRGVLPRLLDSVGCVSSALAGAQGSLGHGGRSQHVWQLLTPESTSALRPRWVWGDGGGPRVHPRPLTSPGRRPGSLWARRQVSDAGLRPGAAPVGQAGGRLGRVEGRGTSPFPQDLWLLLAFHQPPQPWCFSSCQLENRAGHEGAGGSWVC